MLARANRLVSADDFRTVLRRGRRVTTGNCIVSIVETANDADARFGFVVTRKVGNAVNRNTVRRRMKAIAREFVDGGLSGVDVVVRAMPTAAAAAWSALRAELGSAIGERAPR